jgi:glycosyltransferase involved in cell wall biosynthesis
MTVPDTTRTPEDSSEPLVSVVITTRNRLPLLKEAVGSVMAQTLSRCEAVVVDDASTDGTAEWLLAQQTERLRAIILENNVERGAARNLGFRQSRASSVLFLDDDDLLRRRALSSLFAALVREPQAIAVTGGNRLFRGRRIVTSWSPRRTFQRMMWADLMVLWNMPVQAMLWRTEVIRAAGGWNEWILQRQDWELLIRASKQGPILFIPDVVTEIRLHPGHTRPWTMAQELQAEERWLPEHVDSLPPEDREVGDRLVRARRLWRTGRAAYGRLDAADALSIYGQAVRLAPVLLTSPVLRPTTIRDVAKALLGVLVGKRGILAARRAKKTVQALKETRRSKSLHT